MKNKHCNKLTPQLLTVYIIATIMLGLFFFFIVGEDKYKIAAIVVCPMMVIYFIYAYRKEKKADENAISKMQNMQDESYFNSLEWKEKYSLYINEHPFEKAKYQSMKDDLLARFKRKEYIKRMLFMLFLIACSICCMMLNFLIGLLGVALFSILFYRDFSLYLGRPVRKWLKIGIDYELLEKSYLSANFLTYKKNGLAFGLTHIHGYTEKNIYAIDYRLVEGITRKVVRLKKYENGLFASEEYQYFAVVNVRLPRSGKLHFVEIELNEFQVQMAIDSLYTYKTNDLQGKTTVEQKEFNDVV